MILDSGLKGLYFEWMTSIVMPDRDIRKSYFRLLEELNNIPFIYINPLDQNRDVDGKNLIYHFAYRANIPLDVIEENIPRNNEHCSVLEMLVALSFKIEEEIMSDPRHGDRTANWFMLMLDNLGLSDYSDQIWSYGVSDIQVQEIVSRFLRRDIGPNGVGGLFIVRRPYADMREVDIWTQANWYISETYMT